MRPIVSSAKRRIFNSSREARNGSCWLAVLTLTALACSTESNSGDSAASASISETGGPSAVTPATQTSDALPTTGEMPGSAGTAPSVPGTQSLPSQTAATFTGSTPSAPSTSPVDNSGGAGGDTSPPVQPGMGGSVEPPAPSSDAGGSAGTSPPELDTSSTDTSDPSLIDSGSDPTGTDPVGGEQEGGTEVRGATPSCAGEGPGRSNCGVSGDESCCESPLVEGGTFYRSYENTGEGPTALADEATLTSFRLDKYEVSVGRFRRFVEYLSNGGAPPEAGSGKHTHLNDGQGLADSGAAGAFEPGWDASWNELIPTGEGAAATWQSLLATGINGTSGCGLYGSWTEQPGGNEELPITCTSWYESYAFCIWDGGFLPSEAEWKYAAAGGDEHRMYPWGTAELGSDNEYAIYDCCYPDGDCSTAAGRDTCTGFINAAPVGFASLGAGRYGQLDMIGNVFEWALDRFGAYANPCEDCALITANTSDRLLPGAGFHTSLGLGSTILYSWNRASIAWDADTFRGDYAVGFRCARSP